MDPVERYDSIIADPDEFRTACARPLPTAVRVNPIKTAPEHAIAALEDDGLAVEQRAWNAETLLLDTDHPGRTWPYQHGWVHGQEEISQLPATVLDPAPDAVVWDATAAPGGKATQLAAAVDPVGCVVANDDNLGRLSALRANADRLGIANMVVTHRDARRFTLDGFGIGAFDGALVDAPCTGEGTVRKNPRVREQWSDEAMRGLTTVQEDILRRAIRLTRPGGTVVYSTCTFAPEENEGVLSAVLESEECSIRGYETDLEHEPGVTQWQDTSYDPAVSRIKRFYPHLNDTGGFVCAKLQVDA